MLSNYKNRREAKKWMRKASKIWDSHPTETLDFQQMRIYILRAEEALKECK